MRKSYWKFALPTLGLGVSLGLLGSAAPSIVCVTNQTSFVLRDASKYQWVISKNFGESVGNIRHWGNNNFSGKQTSDGGYVVLSETKTQGKSVSRTDSFGNVLWKFDPTDTTLPGYNKAWANKTAVEIVQDQGTSFSNIFYVLLIPDEAAIELKEVDDPQQSYSSITGNVSKQATVVQIVEDLNNYATGSSEWQPRFAVMNSVNIDPKTMVDNYPSNWKTGATSSAQTPAKKGVSYFSVEQHTSWYDDQTGTNGFVMPWRQYVSNLGNMYGIDGKLLMFGGNGSIFNDPEALSIGLFRINFNLDKPEVVGLPYAFVLSGILWNLGNTRPSKYGSTGIWYIKNRPIDYTSLIPLGQDKTFSYVPRMAVAGVQPNFTSSDEETPTYLYLAGTITVGQNIKSQVKEDPNVTTTTMNESAGGTSKTYTINPSKTSTRSLQPSGENAISSQAFTSNPTSENSIDPLMVFGVPLSIGALLTFNSSTATNLYGYTHLMVNGSYYDTNMFTGYQSSGGSNSPHTKPSSVSTTGSSNAGFSYATELDYGIARFSIFSTLLYGYSMKNVGNLVQFYDKDSKDGNPGYSFQLGISTIGFVAPKFDIKSIVYRAPSMFTLPSIYFQNDDNPGVNVFAEGAYVGNNEVIVGTSLYDGCTTLIRKLVFRNWKTEDVAAHWKYGTLSTQVLPENSGANSEATPFKQPRPAETPSEPNPPLSAPVNPEINWSRFRGISSSNKNYLETTWTQEQNVSAIRSNVASAKSVFTVTNQPLLSIFSKNLDTDQVGSRNISLYFGVADNKTINVPSAPKDLYIRGSTSNSLVKEKLDASIPTRANYISNVFVTQEDTRSDLTTVSVNKTSQLLQFNTPTTNSQDERKTVLGSGNFKTQLSNSFLQKNISEILDTGVDVPGVGPTETIIKTPFIPEVFDVVQQPQSRDIKIVATNVDYTRQQLTLTAYALNPDTGTYVLMPGNNATSFGSVNVSNFQGFKALASWILPVAIAIPILVVALVIGLGVGVGLPAQKNKKMLKLGFELQHKKVDTLTTAVGSVFKKIITNTEQAKKAPQMLKASAPAKPGAPKAPGTTAAVRPGAPKPPGAPAAVKPGAPRPVAPKPPGAPASK